MGLLSRQLSDLVCTSDTHTVQGAIGKRTDLTLGHEAVGIVYRIGSEVKSFKEGDRVAVNAITPCFVCDNCLRGCTSHARKLEVCKYQGWRLCRYFHVNSAEANLAHIPDSVPDEQAVYTCDMMSTGFAGAENANIPMGDTVAVFGQGPVGLMATVGSRLQGAGLIIAIEAISKRKKLAMHFGADVVIDFREQDVLETILSLTDGVSTDRIGISCRNR
jgi:Threonine dehydrogenase and related Zn-dependent dehydrogenases